MSLSEVDHVVMFDFPLNPVDYIHRAGRCGRAGRKGLVTALVAKRDKVGVSCDVMLARTLFSLSLSYNSFVFPAHACSPLSPLFISRLHALRHHWYRHHPLLQVLSDAIQGAVARGLPIDNLTSSKRDYADRWVGG